MILFQQLGVSLFGLLLLNEFRLIIRLQRPRPLRLFVLRCVLWSVSCWALLHPESIQAFANIMGVGRGTDILIYIDTMIIIVLVLFLYGKWLAINDQLTSLVRAQALSTVERCPPPQPDAPTP